LVSVLVSNGVLEQDQLMTISLLTYLLIVERRQDFASPCVCKVHPAFTVVVLTAATSEYLDLCFVFDDQRQRQ